MRVNEAAELNAAWLPQNGTQDLIETTNVWGVRRTRTQRRVIEVERHDGAGVLVHTKRSARFGRLTSNSLADPLQDALFDGKTYLRRLLAQLAGHTNLCWLLKRHDILLDQQCSPNRM
jgi:hypothetical protein